MEQILANSTWPDRAKRMCSLKVENHITHSKSAVSCKPISTTINIRNTFFFIMKNDLQAFSYHFPPKVVPSWLHAGFERFSVCIGWQQDHRRKRWGQFILWCSNWCFVFLPLSTNPKLLLQRQWNKCRSNIRPIFFLCSVVLILTPVLLSMFCIAQTPHPHTVTQPPYLHCTSPCIVCKWLCYTTQQTLNSG